MNRRLAACLAAAATIAGLTAVATPAAAFDGPLVSFMTPSDGTVVAGGSVDIEAAAVAIEDGVDITNVVFAADGAQFASDSTYPYTATWASTPGEHILSVTAYDTLGREGGETISITVGSATTPGNPGMPADPGSEDPAPTPGFAVTAAATGECRVPYAVDTTGLTMAYSELDVSATDGVIEEGNTLFYTGAAPSTVTITARAFDGLTLVAVSSPASVAMTPCRPTLNLSPRGGMVGRYFAASTTFNYGTTDPLQLEPTPWTVSYLLDGVRVATATTEPFRVTINASRLTGVHTLVARATNGAGVVKDSAAAKVTVWSASTLGLWSRAVYSGSYSTTVATLKSANDGKAMAGRKVGVRSYRNGVWSAWRTLTTAADGTVRVVEKLPATTVYEFGYAGQTGFGAARGKVTATVVRR